MHRQSDGEFVAHQSTHRIMKVLLGIDTGLESLLAQTFFFLSRRNNMRRLLRREALGDQIALREFLKCGLAQRFS